MRVIALVVYIEAGKANLPAKPLATGWQKVVQDRKIQAMLEC